MSEKKGGNQPHNEEVVKTRRLDDAINQCLEDQKTARKLLPGLYKIPELDDRLNKAEDKYHVLLSTFNEELKEIEQRLDTKFDKLIEAILSTNKSVDRLASELALIIQRFDSSTKDMERLERTKDTQVTSLRRDITYKGDQINKLQIEVATLVANQGSIRSIISKSIPTLASVVAVLASAYAILTP